MRKKIIYKNYTIYDEGFVTSKRRQGTNYGIIACPIGTHGYCVFKIWQNGKTRNLQLHRELAKAFVPNPKNLPCVNHKDGNKLNNSIENLEWCTYSQNLQHAYENKLRKNRSVSGEKYISIESQTNKWRVSVRLSNGKIIKGGRHKLLKDAVAERNNILLAYGN